MSHALTLGQRRTAAAQRPAAGAFWTETLAGARGLGFPADDTAAPRTGSAEPAASIPLPAELTERLTGLSRGQDAALHVVLTAAVLVLLHQHTGESDLVVGQPPTMEGALAQTVPLRQVLDPKDGFRTLLTGLRETLLAALARQDYPAELILPELPVAVALENLHGAEATAALGAETVFRLRRTEGGLELDVLVDPARFNRTTAHRLGAQTLRLLDHVLADPAAPLAELDLCGEAETALFAELDATAHPFPDHVTLPELFERTVAAQPDGRAVLVGDRTYTFAELDVAATRLAHRLRAHRIGAESIVGVLAERSFEMLVGLIAVLKAGGAYLPLDPAHPQERLSYLLEDSGAALVLALPGLAGRLPEGTTTLLLDDLSQGSEEPLGHGAATDAAYVIYTSGSTGRPKGVLVEHRSVVNRLHWMQRAYPIGPGDVVLQKTSISFDVSVWELFWWLIEGATVALLEQGGERNPESIVAAVERHGVTTMHFVPSMLGAFLDYAEAADEGARLSGLTRVFTSGEALGAHHVRRFRKLLDGTELVNLYGPTEATVDVSHHRCDSLEPVVPIGRPIDNTRLYVLDEQRRRRPIGMPGELWIAGDGLARGYLNRPELTAERFVVDPLAAEPRAYRTGDLVRLLPDGAIEYLGRTDFQVKVRGYRIELGEIEQRLRELPGVTDSVVIARTGADGQQHLLGYVQSADAALGEAEIRSRLLAALPEYMVPTRILTLERFPVTANGKLDRKALPEPASAATEYVAPRTERERVLAEIWAGVLGREQVGVTDPFFALGGNSIHFVSVLAQARKHGFEFTFQQMFQHPTIAELVELLDSGEAVAAAPQEYGPFELISEADRAKLPADVEDAYPMAMLQSGLIYQSEITKGNTAYHDIISYDIQSSIDTELFRAALGILVSLSPIFRTSYHLTGYREYLQLVHREVEPPLSVDDLRHLDDEAQDAWYAAWFEREQNRPFDWERPGLVRLHIHVLRDDLYRYSLSQHNSALDGWSINQVHVRLFEIYYTLLAGREYTGKAVTNHLRNFIVLEQESINSPEHQAFWAENLADRPRPEIPRLREHDGSEEIKVVFQDIELPTGLSDRLVALAHRLGVPVKNVLLASHLKVLSVLTGDTDVITGYEHAGRPELPDAEKALGVFLNSMPLRVDLADGSWEDLIRQTYRTEAALLPYRRYPMAKVKQDLRTQETLFETVFNFTHFYSLKQLRDLPEFALLDVRAAAITEFPLRTEYSQHFYTDEVQLSLHYHTAAFDVEHIRRIGGYFLAVLTAMVEDPTGSHNGRPLLDRSELEEIAALAASGGGLVEPAAGEQIAVVDGAGQPAPIGSPGEVVITAPDGSVRTAGRGRRLPDGTLTPVAEPAAVAAEVRAASGSTATEGELSPVAQRIAEMWSEVLDVPVEEIALDDDFFELGGNSMAAMRMVMQLDGLVTLKDVLRNSQLGELVEAAEAAQATAAATAGSTGELLIRLSGPSRESRASLVFVPYAGGNAIAFRPVAEAVAAVDPSVAVFAVELPGHAPESGADELRGLAETAELVAEQLGKEATGPVILWGHCVGSGLTIELTRQLAELGRPVQEVFLAAKLLPPAEEIRDTLANAEKLTFEDIKDWLAEWTGSTGFEELGLHYRDLLVRTFRHDSLTANGYFLAAREAATGAGLSVPATLVVAEDDPVTTGFEQAYREWELFLPGIRLHRLADGGHYFNRTRPDEVARLLLNCLPEKKADDVEN